MNRTIKANASSIRQVPVTKVYLCSHFSLIEGGMLIPSYDKEIRKDRATGEDYVFYRPVFEGKKKQLVGKTRIRERRKVAVKHWIDGKWVSEDELAQLSGKKRKRRKAGLPIVVKPNALIPKEEKGSGPSIWLYPADSTNLVLGSLSKAGSVIGLHKGDVGDSISQMDVLWQVDPVRFLKYGARDAIVTAQVIAFYAKAFAPLTGGELATRIAKYSEIHFKKFFQKLYFEHRTGAPVPVSSKTGKQVRIAGTDWKPSMGYEEQLYYRDSGNLGLEEMIKEIVGRANGENEEYPKTMDQLVDYVMDQLNIKGEI